jgi:hypothetical protein
MSLRGERTAFISIGLARQGALQLYRNRRHISALAGEPLDYSSSFFNWLMVSADEIPRLLERMTAPIESGSFDLPAGEKVPVLAGYRAWLFHEGPNARITRKKLRELVSKYEHLHQNFLELGRRRTRHSVLCNAQNNLVTGNSYLSDSMTVTFDDRLIAATRATLDRLFQAGTNRLLVVARADRLDQPMRRRVRVPAPDDSEWEGDSSAWATVLSAHLRARRSAPAGDGQRAALRQAGPSEDFLK